MNGEASVFINRNRSQGGYGDPISGQKFKNVNQTWYARVNKPEEFQKTSMKYGENLDLKPTKVPMHWSIHDTCDVIKIKTDKNHDYKTNPEMMQWKSFNNYEQVDQHRHNKDMLKDEINNIALRIAKARDAKKQLQVQMSGRDGKGDLQQSKSACNQWRVPEIEHFNRGFNEASRYYNNLGQDERTHGLRYVPPPKADYLYQLHDALKMSEIQYPNYLDDSRYVQKDKTRPQSEYNKSSSQYQTQKLDIHGLLGGPNSQTQDDIANQINKRGKSIFVKKKNLPFKDTYSDTESVKSAARVLKFAGQKAGTFQFPKRERFNEAVDNETKEIRERENAKANEAQAAKIKKLVNKNLNILDNKGGSEKTLSRRTGLSSQERSRRGGYQKSISQSEISRFFKKAKQQQMANAPSEKSADRLEHSQEMRASLTKAGLHKRASTSQQPNRFKVKKYVRKWDCGNPRYAADKAPSQMGLLCGQKSRPTGFAEPTPSEYGAYKTQAADGSNTIDFMNGDRRNASPEPAELLGGHDPYVRPQNAAFDDRESDTLTQQNLQILDRKAGGQQQNDTLDEITFVDYPTLDKDQQDKDKDFRNQTLQPQTVGGHKYGTWGSGYQGGMKLCFQPQLEIQQKFGQRSPNKLIDQDDRMTVATSAVEQMTTISNAPTSVISKEYNKLERNLQDQIKKRFKLQQQIKKMQAKNNKDQKIINMMDNNDRSLKIQLTDQRNMMYSGQNYMRHPQIEDL